MKARIIGVLLVLSVLGVLFVITSEPSNNTRPVPKQMDTEPGSLKDLKIN